MNQMVENLDGGLGVLDGEGTGSPGRAVQVNESPAPHGAPAYVTFDQTAPPTQNDAQRDVREQRDAEERDTERRMDGRGVQEHQLARSGGVASRWYSAPRGAWTAASPGDAPEHSALGAPPAPAATQTPI